MERAIYTGRVSAFFPEKLRKQTVLSLHNNNRVIVVHSVMQACRMHACMGRNGFLQVLQQGAAPEGAERYEALLELLPSRS